jgi:hypothetical protein
MVNDRKNFIIFTPFRIKSEIFAWFCVHFSSITNMSIENNKMNDVFAEILDKTKTMKYLVRNIV